MSEINTGGPAFPILERGGNGLELTSTGLTLRDYFAAQVMHLTMQAQTGHQPKCTWGNAAEQAYKAADALLKAREQ